MHKLRLAIKRQKAVVMQLGAEAEAAYDDRDTHAADHLWQAHAKSRQVLVFLEGLDAVLSTKTP